MDRETRKPASTMWEEGDNIELRIDMPGVAKDDVDIHIDNDQLEIVGKTSAASIDGSFVIRERPSTDYRAVFTLTDKIDRDNIRAEMEDGVLRVTLALREEMKARRITVA